MNTSREFPRRELGIDVARGLCLVLMTIDHLPHHVLDRFSNCMYGPFGFFTGASGFVILSGVVSAWVYGSILRHQGNAASWQRALRRILQLYMVNTLLYLLILAGVVAGILSQPLLRSEFPLFFAHAAGALWRGLLLIHRPGYLDILPMYVLFLALTTPALAALQQGRWRMVVGLSLMAWGGTQLFPRAEPSSLSPLGYQLLFVGGLGLGSWPDLGARMRSRGFARLGRVCLGLAGALFCARVALAAGHIPVDAIPHLRRWTDLDRNGPLRVLNFSLFAVSSVYLWQRLPGRLQRHRLCGWMAYLGRHSLHVFAWSVVVTYLSMALIPPAAGRLWRVSDLVLVVVSLLIPARLHELARARRMQARFGPSLRSA